VIAKLGRAPEITPSSGRPPGREPIVDEHRPVRDDTVIADGHELADECVGLDAAPLANDDVSLDLDERADEAVITDGASVQVDRLDEGDVFPERDVDDSRGKDAWFAHGVRGQGRACVAHARSRIDT